MREASLVNNLPTLPHRLIVRDCRLPCISANGAVNRLRDPSIRHSRAVSRSKSDRQTVSSVVQETGKMACISCLSELPARGDQLCICSRGLPALSLLWDGRSGRQSCSGMATQPVKGRVTQHSGPASDGCSHCSHRDRQHRVAGSVRAIFGWPGLARIDRVTLPFMGGECRKVCWSGSRA